MTTARTSHAPGVSPGDVSSKKMTFTSFEQLYQSRCYLQGEQWKPHFWQPEPIKPEPFTLYGDERSPVRDEWGVETAISKMLALGIHLELPVGEFVTAATQKDLPDIPVISLLLKSNIADEARHLKGFQLADAVYKTSEQHLGEASSISNRWSETIERYHPLLPAMVLEIGVFLITLGCFRLFGGKSLATMSAKIALDEFRHVSTNRSTLLALGLDAWNPPIELQELSRQTLAWCLGEIDIPSRYVGEKFTLDFLLQSSQSLLATGEASAFNETVYIADHVLPFEVSNKSQYSRSLELC